MPIDVLGDLSAMAATLPGVTLIPGADGAANQISVLGLGADQNNITLNGLNFSGTDLPRDATTQTRVTTSSFDPSRGGFSGAQIALRTTSGSNYKVQSVHQTVDAPSLQYTDLAGRQLGQQFTNLQFSGSASGPFQLDKSFYSFSWQLGRRSNNLQDLLNTDPLALERVGVSQDSVARLINMLEAEGIPLSTSAIPSQHLNENGSFLSSFDFAPSGGHNFNITLNGRWSGQDATSVSTTAVPVHGGQTRSYGGALQARHSTYFWDNFLDETSGSLQESVTTGDPYVELPSATVRVNSTFPDAPPGVQNLVFGGSTSLPRNSLTTTGEVQNQLSWISLDNKHRYKFGVDFRYNRYSQDNTTNRFGTYTYNSLQDFEDGDPFSFTRRLQVNRRLGDDLGASAWLGDAYRRTQRFQVTYGVRVDASHFQGNPTLNPLVDSVFGTAERRRAARRVPEPAPRLQLDVRHQSAGRRLPGRGARIARPDLGRRRRVPEPAELAAHRGGGGPDRSAVRGAAVELHRERRAGAQLGRLSVEHRVDPDDVRRQHDDAVEHRAQRRRCSRRTTSRSGAGARTSTGTRRSSTTASVCRRAGRIH